MKNNFNLNIRIGYGYDVHQLKIGENLNLGGIHISHNKGSFGHSDADVLNHSICDALHDRLESICALESISKNYDMLLPK